GGDGTGLGLGRPAAEEVELLLEPGITAEDPTLVFGVAVAHVRARHLELVDDPVEAPRPEDPVPRNDVQVPRAGVLGEVRHRYGAADRAPCREGLTGEHPGERGL